MVNIHTNVAAELVGLVGELEGSCLGNRELVVLNRANLANVRIGGHLVVGEYIGLVLGNAVLADHHLLIAVHDKVAAIVKGTLVVLDAGHVVQNTILGLDHDRDLAKADIGNLFGLFEICLGLLVVNRGTDVHIHKNRGGVGKVAIAGVLGGHDLGAAILLNNHGLCDDRVLDANRHVVLEGVVIGNERVVDTDRVETLDNVLELAQQKVIVGIEEVLDEIVALFHSEALVNNKVGGGRV